MSHEFQNPNNQYDSTWFDDQCCTPNTLDFLLADDWLKPIFDFLHTHSARLDSSQWWNPGEYQGSLNFEAESNPKFLLAVFLSVSRLLVERFWRPQLHQIEERGAWEVVTTINLFFFLEEIESSVLGILLDCSNYILVASCGHLILHFQEFLYLTPAQSLESWRVLLNCPTPLVFQLYNKVSLVSCRCCPDATNRPGEGCQDSWSAFEGPFPLEQLYWFWVEGKMRARQHHKRRWNLNATELCTSRQ